MTIKMYVASNQDVKVKAEIVLNQFGLFASIYNEFGRCIECRKLASLYSGFEFCRQWGLS